MAVMLTGVGEIYPGSAGTSVPARITTCGRSCWWPAHGQRRNLGPGEDAAARMLAAARVLPDG